MDSEHSLPKPEMPNQSPNNNEAYKTEQGYEKFGSLSPELKVRPMPGEQMVQANNAVAQAMTPVVAVQPIGAAQATDDDQGGTSIADDNDVIEKEWVDKAKAIVAQTQGDPRAKSTKLTYLKKDYMQKRYGKIIKVPKDESLATN